jgi:hypothetical protein
MPEPKFVDHEVEVVLMLTATTEDIQAALLRCGIREGNLIGEALVASVSIYSPESDDDE